MLRLGYPNPLGRVYLCCSVERRDDEPEWLGELQIGTGTIAASVAEAPFATTWRDLLDQVLRVDR